MNYVDSIQWDVSMLNKNENTASIYGTLSTILSLILDLGMRQEQNTKIMRKRNEFVAASALNILAVFDQEHVGEAV